MQVGLWDVDWNPDGSYALIVGGYGRVYKYDEKNLIELKTDTRDYLRDVDWRSDGKYALIVGQASVLRYPSSFSENMTEASVDIDPDTLNLKSKGRWITCYIELPEGHDVRDIDASTIQLEDSLQPVLDTKYGFVRSEDSYTMDHDGDGVLERMVKFDRNDVEDMLSPGSYNLKVTGQLIDGTFFEGRSDPIKVIKPP